MLSCYVEITKYAIMCSSNHEPEIRTTNDNLWGRGGGGRVSVRLFLATSDFFVVDSNGLHDIFQESVGLFCRFVEILSIRLIGQS